MFYEDYDQDSIDPTNLKMKVKLADYSDEVEKPGSGYPYIRYYNQLRDLSQKIKTYKICSLCTRFIWDIPQPLGSQLVIIKDTYEGKRGGLGFSKSIDFVGATTEKPTSTAAPAAGGGVTTGPGPELDFSYGEMFSAEEMKKQGKYVIID